MIVSEGHTAAAGYNVEMSSPAASCKARAIHGWTTIESGRPEGLVVRKITDAFALAGIGAVAV
jgi:hypothetical protein